MPGARSGRSREPRGTRARRPHREGRRQGGHGRDRPRRQGRATGPVGPVGITFGSGAPTQAGSAGQGYLDTATGDLYTYEA